jgi:hypothetical protein
VTSPADNIWHLVSGLPAKWRSTVNLMMLQAYFDESGSGQPPVFTMGGFIASAEKWASFSNEWQAVLDMPLRLEYFKMDEAMNLRGQFIGWSEKRRDERLILLFDVIRSHVKAGISCTLSWDIFERFFRIPIGMHAGSDRRLLSRYFFSFFTIFQNAHNIQKYVGEGGPIDFIFDESVMEKDKIMAAWEEYKGLPIYDPNNFLGAPSFRNDSFVLPLQAADMCAWVRRHQWREKTGEVQRIDFPWDKRNTSIPFFDIDWDEYAIWSALQETYQRQGHYISYTFGPHRGIC